MSYNFLADGDLNRPLALVEFEKLRGNHEDLISLVFTDEGQEIFGLGQDYQGAFDRMGEFTSGWDVDIDFNEFGDRVAGLRGADFDVSNAASMFDDDPPSSTLPGVLETTKVTLHAGIIIDFPSDTIILDYVDQDGLPQTILQRGLWRAVPEPSVHWANCVFGFLWFGVRRSSRLRR